jgi:hypothetical protein
MYAKKNSIFFWGIVAFETQKNKGKPKKQSFESKPNILLKVLFFVFFGFPGTPRLLALFFLFFQGFCGFGDSRYLYIIREATNQVDMGSNN